MTSEPLPALEVTETSETRERRDVRATVQTPRDRITICVSAYRNAAEGWPSPTVSISSDSGSSLHVQQEDWPAVSVAVSRCLLHYSRLWGGPSERFA
jgi:hypothetical protein